MLKKNDIVELQVERFGNDGEGVCRADGMAVFVPLALPGEKLLARIVKAQKTYAYGKLEEIISANPQRAVSPCPSFPRCGGCAHLHMDYALSLECKREKIESALRRIGGFEDASVPPVIGAENPYHYRNKAALPVIRDESGRFRAGFYAQRSHRLIATDSCLLERKELLLAQEALLQELSAQTLTAYNEETGEGLIRHLVLRQTRSGEVMAVIVVNGGRLPAAKLVWESAVSRCQKLVSLYININTESTNAIFGKKSQLLYGKAALSDTLCGFEYEISPQAFFQVHPEQTEKLYQTAVDFCEPNKGERIFDLYSGAGTITLPLAARAGSVTGIEIVPEAVENAKENAKRNGITNADFVCGAAEDVFPRLCARGEKPDTILLDPPRKGAEPSAIKAIIDASPKKVVYVSCDPATQARDLKLLGEGGYRLVKTQGVDMFCWCAGVENVALMMK
ncbi:MAG: 23S rRNA (uracil(1939)-C(5))-methyltransferase RlmD [Eubacteriales bacterium]|nr:23S rRNA (uracil(1939)-C(5))-methyltransferase RlmD [Eubacteriales bacterium]MDD3882670.1 23S rRNA (uracil(1939)-C(5))-methyltransferase RlmD [Eubacteriales bacterium]MDD4512758.1 23S rRNA (uracil(1939)-C(5))-methyltransferase RlmD [Eubacteriales bacterium]